MRYCQKNAEDIIYQLALDPGLSLKYDICTRIANISEIPTDSFEEIRKNGIIRKAPTRMYSAIFEVTATSMMKLMFYFFTIGIIGFPILGLIGTIFYAWWCLLVGLVLGILSFKISRWVYCAVIFDGAISSEIVFSFLFCSGAITLELPGYGILYRR